MTPQLPTKSDFVEHAEDLDQICAWEHFGGLTISEAKARFAENALYYQEDFMFMGTNAFLFYFPVLEDYLLTAPQEENDDDYESWIICQCIRAQFDADTNGQLRPLAPAIRNLARFIREHIDCFGCSNTERVRISEAWADLVGHIDCSGHT